MLSFGTISKRRGRKASRLSLLVLLAVVAALLAGCGSTKVYTADKTIVYAGSLYNMGNVQRISPRVDGQLPDGTTVKMTGMDKNAVESLLKQHGQIAVATYVEMDSQGMLYKRGTVKRYSDYNKLADDLQGAMNDINKFMKDKKKTQLNLR